MEAVGEDAGGAVSIDLMAFRSMTFQLWCAMEGFYFNSIGRWYKLVGREPVLLEGWPGIGEGLDSDRRIAISITAASHVSTVFLCLDHNPRPGGPPLLFETMVFEREVFGISDTSNADVGHDYGVFARYSTYDEAEAGHSRILQRVLELEKLAIKLMPNGRREFFEKAHREAESINFTV